MCVGFFGIMDGDLLFCLYIFVFNVVMVCGVLLINYVVCNWIGRGIFGGWLVWMVW